MKKSKQLTHKWDDSEEFAPMDEELKEILTDLMSYYEMQTGECPMDDVYSGGNFHRGIISNELYSLLLEIQTKLSKEEE